jgi:hypothetical protein
MLVMPILALLQDALTVRATLALTVVATLVALLCAPLLATVGRRFRGAPAVLVTIGVVTLVTVVVRDRPSADRPSTDSLTYRLDSDAGEAQWLSFDRRPSVWNRTVLGDDPTRVPRPFPFRGAGTMMMASSGPISVPAPDLQPITTEARYLRVRLLSPRGGAAAWVEAKPASGTGAIEAVWVDAHRLLLEGDSGATVRFRITGLPATGVALGFEHTGALEVQVVDQPYALPAVDGLSARPATQIAVPTWLNDSTLVSKTFRFE